jgi:hypothetical protein
VLGGLGAILGGISVILHAIAPRTKTQLDDRAAAGVDAAHAKLDQVLGLLRGIVPGGSASVPPAATPSAASAPSSGAKASTVAAVALLAAMIGGVALAPGCSTISSDVKAFESGAVACAKADSAQAKALGLQLGIDALAGLLAGQDAETMWAKVTADAEAGAKSQGIAVGACAFDGVIADVEKILHPTTPGTATSALAVATAVDPLAAGRAALAAFERAHGVTSVVR